MLVYQRVPFEEYNRRCTQPNACRHRRYASLELGQRPFLHQSEPQTLESCDETPAFQQACLLYFFATLDCCDW